MSYIGNTPLTQAERKVIDHNVTATATYSTPYTIGLLDVILNGITLQSNEYTATDGLTIVLNSATIVGDTLTTVAWGTFETASVAPDSVGESALDVNGLQVAGLLPTAWCTFDGTLTGTNAPTAGYNVSSVTRNSVGYYTINFTTPMDNNSYAYGSGSTQVQVGVISRATTNIKIKHYSLSSVLTDGVYRSVIIFGGKD